jgi:hypothetical protein
LVDDRVDEAITLLRRATALLEQVARPAEGTEELSARDIARVESVGEVAHRHLAFVEQHGSMTRKDSLAIRRELYGPKVRATANLFGTKDSGALFYRPLGHDEPAKDDDPVDLTDEGRRIATLYRSIRGL